MPPRFQDKQPLKTLAKASKSCAKEVSVIWSCVGIAS